MNFPFVFLSIHATHKEANIFLLNLQGGDSMEVSVSELGTGCPFSCLNPGSVKPLISWFFALDFPQSWKKYRQSHSGEMGKVYFPGPGSSLDPQSTSHPFTTYTHTPSQFLSIFSPSSLAYVVLFCWSLALVMTADWHSWQFPGCLVRQNFLCKTRM